MVKQNTHEFGRYLRRMRTEDQLSLRKAAKKLGISAVYLGEVERGVRPPLKESRWEDLIRAIPSIERDTLARLAINSKPVQLDLRDSPPKYQNLTLALARRIEKQNLSSTDIERLFSILGEDNE